ncbi:MAG: hypothetical protein AAGD38_07990 [Acidobacteriota bacterium]
MIHVPDLATRLAPFFTVRHRPRDLLKLAEPHLQGPEGLMSLIQPILENGSQSGLEAMQVVQIDGYDACAAQQGWGLFNPTRKVEASAWAFERFVSEDVPGRVHAAVERALGSQADLTAYVLPADPAHRNLMVWNRGLSGFGGTPGFLLAELWPSDGNLARLDASVTRWVTLGRHWADHPPAGPRPTLGEMLNAERKAAQRVAELCPEEPMPWACCFRTPDDWPATLDHIASLYGVASFSKLDTNVYATVIQVGNERPPEPRPLDMDERAYVEEVIDSARDETSPSIIAAHLYGDDIAARFGHDAAGLPAYAGFAL